MHSPHPASPLHRLTGRLRLWLFIGLVYLTVSSSLKADSFLESRYQYYQEEHNRVRVNSSYSLFGIDLNDTTKLDGTILYSAISGSSPIGYPPFIITKRPQVPLAYLIDERYAFGLGLTKQYGNHAIRAGFNYSLESDYVSYGYSLEDTILLNEKNTELVIGFSFDDDRVGANGTSLNKPKRSYDSIIGLNQILGPNDLVRLNVGVNSLQGDLADPYKLVLINSFFVARDTRPRRRTEELFFFQWTHYLPWGASVEPSYRYGHNDFGSDSHTGEIAYHQKLFGDRLILSPYFRYYWQSAADFYATQFFGHPRFHSSDYRLSKEQTMGFGLQARIQVVPDKIALDLGVERYVSRGLDRVTPQSSYPDALSITAGFHLQF